MTTIPQKRPAVKPTRSYKWLSRAASGRGVVEIRLHHPRRTELFRYVVSPLACLFGVAVRFAKAGDPTESYDVLLASGEEDSCECMGFLRHGACKHLDAARVMRGRGEIGGGA